MHRPARADGPFELAPATTDLAAVLGPPKLDLDLATEKRQLHRDEPNDDFIAGNVVPTKIDEESRSATTTTSRVHHR